MSLMILMIGNDLKFMVADAKSLRKDGFRVQLCDEPAAMKSLLKEVQPDIAFINASDTNQSILAIYHALLDDVVHANLPVIFTLKQNDVYLVNRKRTALKSNRCCIAVSASEAVEQAAPPLSPKQKYPFCGVPFSRAKSA